MNSLKNGHHPKLTCQIKFICLSFSILTIYSPAFAEENFLTADSYALSAVRYKLAEGSVLIDDSSILMRPTVMVPIHGSFYLQRLALNPLFTNYAVQNLHFSGTGPNNSYIGKFSGTYRYGGEFALTEQMTLKGYINNCTFLTLDSSVTIPTIRYPWIEIDLTQIDPNNPLHYYRLHLVAVPWPRLWFSTQTPFKSGLYNAPVSDGDLLSNSGRIIRTNQQLTARLGIMPAVPDIGLDAVMLSRSTATYVPDIWFSAAKDVFSESLGMLHNGDLLSDTGHIVKPYTSFISPFMPMLPITDYGLDAVARNTNSSLLFSVKQGFFSQKLGRLVSNGDLLSENGTIFRTQQQLLADFQITSFSPATIGLDAVYLWPHGEIWFSTAADFNDQRFGHIGHGDLLSDYGRIVARNSELVAPFKSPASTIPTPLPDLGLDALYVLWPMALADLNDDGVVDMFDFAIFANGWSPNNAQSNNSITCDFSVPADDNEVKVPDCANFAENWLSKTQ